MGRDRSDSARARIAVVAAKEIVDIFRDRRTMLVTLVTAIAAGPVLMLLVLNLVARQADTARELSLPVVGREPAPALAAFLERQQVTLTPAPAPVVSWSLKPPAPHPIPAPARTHPRATSRPNAR